jgi:hypothetical protein
MTIENRLLELERTYKHFEEAHDEHRAIIFGQGQLIMHQSSLDVDVSARTSDILKRISKLENQIAINTANIDLLFDEIPVLVRIDSTHTPYVISLKHIILFCDTDNGAIKVTLKPGNEHDQAKIINTGSSGNDLTVYPDVTHELYGAGAGVPSILSDGEVINVHKETTEGWW